MGADFSVLDEYPGQEQAPAGRVSTSSDEVNFEVSGHLQDWMVVTSKNARDADDRVLEFNPSNSRAVCAGVGYALNKVLSKSDLGESTEMDPRRFYSMLRGQLGFPAKHVECLTSKSTQYPATMSNFVEYVTEAAEKVGEDGLLFLSFSGHGRVRENPDGSRSGILVTADNYGSNSANLLTARHFEICLKKCRAKYIVVFLDCCHAGLLASSLAENSIQSQSEVYVLAACSTSEVSLCHSELGGGFFTFFLSDFVRRHGEAGKLPIGAALRHAQLLCPAMAELCLHSERDKAATKKGTRYVMHPLMRTRFPLAGHQQRGTESGAEGAAEDFSLDAVDAAAPTYRSNDELSTKFLSQFVTPAKGSSVFNLVPETIPVWLIETAMPSIQTLYRHGYLSPSHDEYREVLRCALSLISRSVAIVFVDYGDGEASDPDMFLAFFTYVYHAFVQAVEDTQPLSSSSSSSSGDGDGDAVKVDGEKPKILNHHAVLALHHYVAGMLKALGGEVAGMQRHMELILDMKSALRDDDDDVSGMDECIPTKARIQMPAEPPTQAPLWQQQQHIQANDSPDMGQLPAAAAGRDEPDHPVARRRQRLKATASAIERILQRLRLDLDVRVTSATTAAEQLGGPTGAAAAAATAAAAKPSDNR